MIRYGFIAILTVLSGYLFGLPFSLAKASAKGSNIVVEFASIPSSTSIAVISALIVLFLISAVAHLYAAKHGLA